MTYLEALVAAAGAALLVGVGTGVVGVLTGAVAKLRPEDKAVVYSAAVAEAMNCTAFFALVLAPFAVILVFTARK